MQSGVIKWFSATKNFGFIETNDGQPDVFFHGSAVGDDLPEVLDGVRIRYSLVPSPKKPGKFCASHVELAKRARQLLFLSES
jgi:cold shock protein